MLSCGYPIAQFNPTFAVGPVPDPTAACSAIVAFYDELGVPFTVFVRDEVTPGLSDSCLAAGLVHTRSGPLMVMDPIAPAPAAPDGLSVRVVDAGSADEYAEVVAAGFGMPLTMARTFFGEALLGIEGCTAFLGTLGGTPVGTSALFRGAGVAGVYNVATLPDHRGRGIGAALTWAAVEEGRRQGETAAILQASDIGEPVYRRMGFATPTHYRQFQPASGS